MQHFWLHKCNNSDLIIFFTGWSMMPNSVDLSPGNKDIVVFFDYSNVDKNFIFQEDIYNYKNIYVVAWSLGIVVANLLRNKLKPLKTIAINGSLFPSHDLYGIPTTIYENTCKFLDEKNLAKFHRRMFLKSADHNRFCLLQNSSNFIKSLNISKMKKELINIKDISDTISKNDNVLFDKVIISKKDKIFPLENLVNLWRNYSFIDSGHYPFFEFNNWEDILNA
jgi:pimeloyl-[acyl-carrier protein] methyl ester esterase